MQAGRQAAVEAELRAMSDMGGSTMHDATLVTPLHACRAAIVHGAEGVMQRGGHHHHQQHQQHQQQKVCRNKHIHSLNAG